MLLIAIGSVSNTDPEPINYSPSPDNTSTPEPTPPPTPEPTPPPTPKNQPDPYNTPPQVNIDGRTYRTTEANAFIDGFWKLQFSVGATRHDAILYMEGSRGGMRVQYFSPFTNKTEKVDQIMRLWSSSQGLIVKGYNPIDAETKQPHPTYVADEFLFQQQPDGTFYVANCDSISNCSPVAEEFLGTDIDQK